MFSLFIDGQPAGYSQMDLIMGIGMIVLFGAIMYFMIYLPQKKRESSVHPEKQQVLPLVSDHSCCPVI